MRKCKLLFVNGCECKGPVHTATVFFITRESDLSTCREFYWKIISPGGIILPTLYYLL